VAVTHDGGSDVTFGNRCDLGSLPPEPPPDREEEEGEEGDRQDAMNGGDYRLDTQGGRTSGGHANFLMFVLDDRKRECEIKIAHFHCWPTHMMQESFIVSPYV